jgi:hypothetical protein
VQCVANTNGVAKRYTYYYGYAFAHAYSNSNGYAYTDSYTYGHANRHLRGNLYDNYYHWYDNPRWDGYRQPLRRLHY